MKLETFQQSTTVTAEVCLEFISIEDQAWLYRRRQAQKIATMGALEGPEDRPSKSRLVAQDRLPDQVEYGLVNAADRQRLLRGHRLSEKRRELSLLVPGGREEIRLHGPKALHGDIVLGLVEAFDRAAAGEMFTALEVVHINWDDMSVQDMHGQQLPVAVEFDYIFGEISEADYPLDRVLDHLSQHPEIELIEDEENVLSSGVTARPGLQEIPYYNAEEGKEWALRFWWQPTPESYAKVWAHSAKVNRECPILGLQASALELDLFGIAPLAYAANPPKAETLADKSPTSKSRRRPR